MNCRSCFLNTFLLCLLLVTTIANAQTPHCITDRYAQIASFDSTAITISSDVHFATAPRWPDPMPDSMFMDIYMPNQALDNVNLRPLIVMIHGGAFYVGSRQELAYHCMEMARRGFVTATIDYRLGWDCPAQDILQICPQCGTQAGKMRIATYRAVQDARAALRFLAHSSQQYGIDTTNVFMQGESAGSVTALHTTFWNQAEADQFCPTCDSVLGPLDSSGNNLVGNYTIRGVVNNCGAITSTAFMDGHDIPVIGFHDDLDCVVAIQNAPVINCLGCNAFYFAQGSQSIQGHLFNNGICRSLNTVSLSLNHCSYPANALIRKSSCFLKSILCANCTSSTTNQIWNIPDCTAGNGTVGLADLPKQQVTIVPNPGRGQITVGLGHALGCANLRLISTQGKVLLSTKTCTTSTILNTGQLASGLYLLQVEDADGSTSTARVIVNP